MTFDAIGRLRGDTLRGVTHVVSAATPDSTIAAHRAAERTLALDPGGARGIPRVRRAGPGRRAPRLRSRRGSVGRPGRRRSGRSPDVYCVVFSAVLGGSDGPDEAVVSTRFCHITPDVAQANYTASRLYAVRATVCTCGSPQLHPTPPLVRRDVQFLRRGSAPTERARRRPAAPDRVREVGAGVVVRGGLGAPRAHHGCDDDLAPAPVLARRLGAEPGVEAAARADRARLHHHAVRVSGTRTPASTASAGGGGGLRGGGCAVHAGPASRH